MEMRTIKVDNSNLKLVFLDLMDYLNKNAYNICGDNFKSLIFRAIYEGKITKSDYTKKLVELCDARNEIAHGNGLYNNDINEKRLVFMYTTGLFLLGLYSKKVDVQIYHDDIIYYVKDKPVFRQKKLIETFKVKKLIYIFEEFF